MHKIKRSMWMGIVVLASFTILLTGPADFAAAAGKEAKIGLAFSMTGAAAGYGATQKNGVQLAVDEINAISGADGLKLIPIFDDDASTPSRASMCSISSSMPIKFR